MPDVNVLVYAHRREDPDHEFYRAWMEKLANRAEPFALSIDSLVLLENCIMTESGGNHWPLFKALCEKTGASGKLVGDAQHAAMAIEHGCTWVTRDTDFDRFRAGGLRLEILQP